MEDLEDETSAAHAKLESGDWVFEVPSVVRTPLNIEADDEAVETVVVDEFGVGDPRVNDGGCVCNRRGDGVFVECDVVHVVGIGGRHRRGYGFCGGAWLLERMRI